jgi:hypothetical protein
VAATQLNLADRIAVRAVIRARCTAAVVNYALYLLGLPGTTEQLAWAREAIRAPDPVGDSVSWHVLNQTDFLDHGSGIADNVLTGAVETAINAHFIQVPPE